MQIWKRFRSGFSTPLFIIFEIAVVLIIFMAVPTLSIVQAAYAFNDPAFNASWNRVDLPVQREQFPNRGYTWGPPLEGSGAIVSEPYNGAARPVQYFDKGRMEINPAAPDPNDLWHVTSGLLVTEMVTGRHQTGDDTFVDMPPTTQTVVGDPGNPLAPSYAVFQKLLGPQAAPVSPSGSTAAFLITERIDQTGNVSSFVPPELRSHNTYDNVTHHYIADVFTDYAALVGPVYRGSYIYVDEQVFTPQNLYIFGHPITEPYWTRSIVGGTEKDVLVQLFERRVLTYTPSNTPANRVEMGNVGQHYFIWRYGSVRQGESCREGMPTPVTMKTPTLFPDDSSQFTASSNASGSIPQGGAGNVFTYTTGVESLYSAPALTLDEGMAVFSAGENGLMALRLNVGATGHTAMVCEAWRYNPTQPPPSPHEPVQPGVANSFWATPLLYNGMGIVGDSTGTLHAVRLSDGASLWTNTAPHRSGVYSGIYGTPITDGERVYFAARTDEFPGFPFGPTGGRLYAVNISDGSLAWESPNISGAAGQVVFGFYNNLFFGAFDGQVYSYTRAGQSVPGWPSVHLGYYASGPVGVNALNYANGFLYVSNGGIYVLDRNARIVDSIDTSMGIGALNNPAITGDTLYFSQEYITEGKTPEGQTIINHPTEIIALNAQKLSEERFTFQTDFPNGSSVTVVDGYIYFWAEERLFQVKADGSGSNRQLLLGGSGGSVPIVRKGIVYVAGGDGNFYIIK